MVYHLVGLMIYIFFLLGFIWFDGHNRSKGKIPRWSIRMGIWLFAILTLYQGIRLLIDLFRS